MDSLDKPLATGGLLKAVLTALLLAATLSLVPVNPAEAAFPGTNGKIVFVSTRNGNEEIYVMTAAGAIQTRLTTIAAIDNNPAWSPDGTRIAFVSERDFNAEIYVMNADGSNPIRLTTNAAEDRDPAWQLGTDTDADGVINLADNCTLNANPTQLDADHDGYGNICDADLNNSALVTTADFAILRARLNTPPGPSGLACAGTVPCP